MASKRAKGTGLADQAGPRFLLRNKRNRAIEIPPIGTLEPYQELEVVMHEPQTAARLKQDFGADVEITPAG